MSDKYGRTDFVKKSSIGIGIDIEVQRSDDRPATVSRLAVMSRQSWRSPAMGANCASTFSLA